MSIIGPESERQKSVNKIINLEITKHTHYPIQRKYTRAKSITDLPLRNLKTERQLTHLLYTQKKQ